MTTTCSGAACTDASIVDFAHDWLGRLPSVLNTQGRCGTAVYQEVPVDVLPSTLTRLASGSDSEVRLSGRHGPFELSVIGHLNAARNTFRHLVVSMQA